VDEEPKALVRLGAVLACDRCVALKTEFGDGIRNGIVQAPIQRAEFFDGERRVTFERQVGDRLAEVSVVVHDLIDGVT
jgi:hypothetical protein